ncbi:signal peptidase I [Candidatus Desantisbacteria bacterium CG07_land_8_20_14_0_80_39_15]|uniref:Signal peptidase I n=1 Tax=Candidatus Desantisbacteria bacterium CG07_land_8_20_14_0_80_39_15 TaxID=1974549 RepID=A0A2M6ZEU8_9BACT|nr:MAG: signal peptidase I [Candidatus Desantisbacteria bacterium CG07_land_8_20_14_0_80_39_15]
MLAAVFYRIVIRRKTFYLPKEAKEWIEVIVFAGFLAFNIRVFAVQAYKIPSGSMIPTFQVGDHLFVSKFNYWFKMPERGDIVVFKFPEDPKKDFIKRVIAVESDTVQIVNKQVFVNGAALIEPYKMHCDPMLIPGEPRDNFRPLSVPKGYLFMIGDNRDKSYDSRFWGFLPKENLKGRALFIYWPFTRVRIIK